nr:hypothetical protein [Pseudonocardia nigra]
MLERPVVDAAGRRVGRVRDVRLVCDGPVYEPSGEPAPRVAGLVVGRPFGGDRLGFGRTVDAPWLLARLFAALRRRQHYVDWADVAELGPPVVLSVTADRLEPFGPEFDAGTE